MNSAAENDTMASVKKLNRAMLNPASWSIKWKILLNFLIRAIVAIGLLIAVINLIQRRNSFRETTDKLLLLTEAKSASVEEYFNHISQKLAAFSTDRSTLEAFNQLNNSFLSIENENYFTPTVTSIDRLRLLTEGFYNAEILPALSGVTTNDINLKALLPDDNRQLIMQYLYLAGNSKSLGSKHLLVKAEDGSTYSYMHAQYHPEMLKAIRKTGISDIIFVDYKTGYVTYSVKKNLDFGTSLFEGPYKNSGLGMAFKSAIAGNSQGTVSYTDVSLYLPDIYKPCLFISAPVYSGAQLLGAVVFKIDVASLDHLLAIEKDRLNFGQSLKTILIGPDLLYRNNDPEFSENPSRYLRKLKHHSGTNEIALKASEYKSTALIQPVDLRIFEEALKGKEGVVKYETETGNKVLCSYAPLKIANLNWIILSQINTSDALASLHRLMRVLIVITLLIALILYFISNVVNRSINERLAKLGKSLTSLAKGERLKDIDTTGSDDEIGKAFRALEKLNKRISFSSSFVSELGKGNIEIDFPVEGEDDSYGLSMKNLRQNLMIRREEEEKRKKEDEIRNWTTHGIASFNDVLRMDNNDLGKLSINIVRNLISYLNACQGALFLIEEEETKYLKMVAAYAYDRQKFMKKRIEIGEGLAGTCVLEKKTILTNKIPDNYISITSGLGGSKPKCLMIVPLKKDDEVLGVLELASLEDFKPYEVEFVEKVGESIASALITVKLHVQTSQYLERFQQQTEEMKAQDEELRQNIEELQATHEQMERLKQEENERNQTMMKELEDYRQLLLNVLDNIPGRIYVKDAEGRLLLLNSEAAKVYKKTVSELIGTSDFDNYPVNEAQVIREAELKIMKSGPETYIEEESLADGKRFLRITKMPLYLPHISQTGLLGIQIDVTDMMLVQEEIKKKEEALLKEKALMDALMNNVPDSIYFKDRQSKFLRVSKSMLQLFGLKSYEELMGKSDFDFFAEEHARPAYLVEQEIIKTGKAIIDLEEKEVLEDGRVNWITTTKMPLIDNHGEIIGTFGISKNISHIKKLQQEALEKTEELKAQEEELKQNLEEMQTTQEDLIRQVEENKKIQEELGKEKALMDALMNNLPELVYFKDRESKFIKSSKSMLKHFKLQKPEELIGKSDFDFFAEEHSRPAYEDEQRIIRTGKAIIDLEEREVMEDGTFRWVNTTKMPLLDNNGKIIGTFGITKDISHLKKMQQEAMEKTEELKAQEEELKQNLEEMQTTQEDLMRQVEENKKIQEALGKETALMDALMNNVPDSIYFKDKKSRFLRVSRSLLNLFGLKKEEELIGKSDFDFFAEEHARPAYLAEQNIIKTGKPIIDLEEKEVLEDGRINWITTTKMPLVGPNSEIIGTFGISKNISHIKKLQHEALEKTEELKAQEEELKQNLEEMLTTQEDLMRQVEENKKIQEALGKEKSLMDALMNNLPELIYFKDRESKFIRFSKSMLKHFGLKKEEELIGKSDFDFFAEEHARPAFLDEQNIIRTGKAIIDLEEKEVSEDGKVNWVNTTKMPLKNSAGEIVGTFGMSKSITRIKKLEIEANEKAAQIKETEKKMVELEKEIARLRKGK